jgi:hypothetical protein
MAQVASKRPTGQKAWWLTPATIGALLGFLLGQVPAYHDLYRKWFAEPIAVNVSMAAGGTPFVFRAYKLPGSEWTAVSERSFIFVTLHNRGERAISLESYSVAVLTAASGWIPLAPLGIAPEPVPVENTALVSFQHKSEMRRLDEEKDCLERKLAGAAFPSGATVSGWIFFGTPINSGILKVRFTFVDREGKTHEVSSVPPSLEPEARRLERIELHWGPVEPIPEALHALANSLPN